MKLRLSTRSLALFLVASVCTAPIAGQVHAAEKAAATSADDQNGTLDAVIVTGVGAAQRKFDASFAVSNLKAEEIQKIAPINFADLLGQVPGVYAEATGGEVQNVIRVRGIPDESSFQAYQEDGMRIYPDDGYFFKGEGLIRPDLMTQSMEFVLGGPSPVYASNASAIFNNITRQGADVPEGALQATIGDTKLYRIDGYWAGKIADKTYLAAGGFLRRDDGARPMGFPSAEGGQFRINLRREIEGGEVRAFVKVLDDHDVFYLPIPVADPRNPSVSLDPYISYFKGTLNSPYLQNTVMLYPNESGQTVTKTRDLSNGRHMKFFDAGLDFDRDFNGWKVSNKLRFLDGTTNFDALYSTSNPADATVFANSFKAKAQAAFGATTPVATMGYALAGTNGVTKYTAPSGLVIQAQYRAIDVSSNSIQNETRVSRDIEFLGKHQVTAGLYLTEYQTTVDQHYENILFELATKPRLLDLVAYNAAGATLGSVTYNGVLNEASNATGGSSDFKEVAWFLADNWKITDKLRIDYGIRQETWSGSGVQKKTQVVNLNLPGSLAGAAAIGFNGQVNLTTYSETTTPWTVGLNYDYSRNLGFYARASKAYRVSGEANLFIGIPAITEGAEQYEVGAKLNTRQLSVFLTAYYTKYSPFNASLLQFDAASGTLKTFAFVGETVSPGVEADISWKPTSFFSVDAALTYQEARYESFANQTGLTAALVNGKQVIRTPDVYGNIRPNFHFQVGAWSTDTYLRYNFVGDRFVDYYNTSKLPAFQTVAGGVTAEHGPWRIQFVGENLTNEKGLTEGNPRADVVAGQGTAEAVYGRPLLGRSFKLVGTYHW